MLRIVADENISLAREAFSTLADIVLLPGREIHRQHLRHADALLVRSITAVNRALLHKTDVQFVGTATIGTDHLDTDFLTEAGIAFASAAGSNANAVAEYVFTAIAHSAVEKGLTLPGSSIGIVGVGHIGGRVKKLAQALGMQVLLCDPPLQRRTGSAGYLSLEQLFEADFLTLHVPLNLTGIDKTHHLLDHRILHKLRPDVVLINTSRGAVIDNSALLEWADRHPQATLILDVWENEPVLDMRLLERTNWSTPHIAGYSLEGKINGTHLVYKALCRHFGQTPQWQPPAQPKIERITTVRGDAGIELALYEATRQAYPLRRDHQNLQKMSAMPAAGRADYFDRLRKTYPLRREFGSHSVRVEPTDINIALTLSAFGFSVMG